MKKSYALLSLMIFTWVGGFALAETPPSSPENKLNEIRKFCARDKKPKEVCACVVKNLHTKFKNAKFSEKQLDDAVLAAKHSADAPDYVADLITGIEFHCMEKSNYLED